MDGPVTAITMPNLVTALPRIANRGASFTSRGNATFRKCCFQMPSW